MRFKQIAAGGGEMKEWIRQMLVVCVCWSVLAGQANADSLADAQHASDKGDYAKAAKLLKPLAKNGNAAAQFKLATLYYRGKGLPPSQKEALRLYRLSAEQGHTVAQSNLATMYYRGEGIRRDYVMAYMWKNLAAANADSERRTRYREQLEELMRSMTAREIAEAKALAKKCTARKFKGCKRK